MHKHRACRTTNACQATTKTPQGRRGKSCKGLASGTCRNSARKSKEAHASRWGAEGRRKKSRRWRRKQPRTTAGARDAKDRADQTDWVRMPLLPSISLQQCSQRESSCRRALRQAVSRPKPCRCTCFRPCLPYMWHGGPVGERFWENTKQTQEAWWQSLSKNAMAVYVKWLGWAWFRNSGTPAGFKPKGPRIRSQTWCRTAASKPLKAKQNQWRG